VFEGVTLCVIIANCIVLVVEDPTQTQDSDIFFIIDIMFLLLYSIELLLKVCEFVYLEFSVGPRNGLCDG
jgi:hypothetical protein